MGPPKIEEVDVFRSNIICFYKCLNDSGIIELNNFLHAVYRLIPVSYFVSKKREKMVLEGYGEFISCLWNLILYDC
jgi:hypothetical protein